MIARDTHDVLDDDRVALRARLGNLVLVLGLIGVVAAVALWYVGRDILRVTTQVAVEVVSVPETAPEVIPPFPATENPLAVLVLDVSGSMRHTDPRVETFRAASAFVTLFRHMAGGAATGKSVPNVAVVLYGSVAGVVPWSGAWWRTLSSGADAEAVLAQIRPFLAAPEGGQDPRAGWHTDHRAAARTTAEVIERYVSQGGSRDAVCVVFLTDGMFDPSPLLDEGLPPEVREANAEEFWRRLASQIGPSRAGEALGAMRDEFERNVADGPLIVTPGAEGLEGRLFPVTTLWRGVSRTWSPGEGWYARAVAGLPVSETPSVEELAGVTGVGPGGLYREVVLAVDDPRLADIGRKRGAMVVLDPKRLDLAFAAVLSEWLRLQEQGVEGSGPFTVNPGARSLAVLATGPDGPAQGSVLGPGVHLDLMNGIALVESPKPGTWTVEVQQAAGARAQIYSDVRSKWALHDVPVSFSILDIAVESGLALYNLETGRRESPSALYREWPASVRVTLTMPDGSSAQETAVFDESMSSYRFRIPLPGGGTPGPVRIQGVVEGLVYDDGRPAPGVRVEGATEVRRAIRVRLVAQGADGTTQPVGAVERMSLLRGTRMLQARGEARR